MPLEPVTITPKPKPTQPLTALSTLHQFESGANAASRNWTTGDGSDGEPTGSKITGTASCAGRTPPVDAVAAWAPVTGGRARVGEPTAAAPTRPQNGPAASASGQPAESPPTPPDAAKHAMSFAKSAPFPVARHPPKDLAISIDVPVR